MPPPEKPRNAFADPLGYMREVGTTNRKIGAELQAKRSAEMRRQAEINARNAKMRKMLAPRPKVPGPRFENPFPMTDEAREAERQVDEMLEIKRQRRNAFAKPTG